MQFKITRSLQQIKLDAAMRIDRLAGEKRQSYITVAPGQEATYTAKLNDAKAYIAAGYPADATPYVWINAESVATGDTPQIVADLIVSTAAQWSVIGAQIEGARQSAKRMIAEAISVLQIRAAELKFKSDIDAI